MPASVLIVRFSSAGDLVLTTPLLRALRTRHPDAEITFVVRADLAELLRHNPHIDHLEAWEHGSSLTALADRLRDRPWTHRLDLHCSLRSYRLRRLVGGRWRGYPKHRVRRQLLVTTHRRVGGALGPVAERYFAAARELDVVPDGKPAEIFTSAEVTARADQFLAAQQLGTDRPLLALAPGAAHYTKRWPERRWIELVQQLGDERDIVVMGGRAEEVVAAAIVDAAPANAVSTAGEFSYEMNAAILRRSQLLVAGDTGMLHIAAAVGTPVVGLYGPTVEEFGFFPYRARYVAVQHDLSCRPCSTQGGVECPLRHHNCLVGIAASEVRNAITTLSTPTAGR